MDVERLRLLRELAERGTVSAAAQAMSLTPSAVSQQLKILQREAGVPLLEPDGRRLRLTDAGRILVTRTDEILAALDRAQADMDSYRTTPRGTVRVGIFGSGAAVLLAGLITQAAARGVECWAASMTSRRPFLLCWLTSMSSSCTTTNAIPSIGARDSTPPSYCANPWKSCCRRGIASPPASECRCANLRTNHGSVWDGGWYLTMSCDR